MGRHTAPDGDAVHPVVAEALSRRATSGEGSHRDEGPLGWPAEPPAPGSGGLGWPGDLAPTAPVAPVRDIHRDIFEDEVPDDEVSVGAPPEQPTPPLDGGRRRGWRRLFGLDRAA